MDGFVSTVHIVMTMLRSIAEGDIPSELCKDRLDAAKCSALSRRDCYYHAFSCCQTCSQYDSKIPGCRFGDIRPREYCPSEPTAQTCRRIGKLCCETCAPILTAIEGCLYGDESWCDGNMTSIECYINHKPCCQTCSKLHTGIAGCEYGDRIMGADCPLLKDNECYSRHDKCCHTCHQRKIKLQMPNLIDCDYGDRSMDCNSVTLTRSFCTMNRQACCKSCHEYLTPNSDEDDCMDEEDGQCSSVNIRDCLKDDDVYNRCCQTCNSFKTQQGRCEYGDLHANCKDHEATFPFCLKNGNVCCKHCEGKLFPAWRKLINIEDLDKPL